jgi:uncharacterized delta-60 repeat protein
MFSFFTQSKKRRTAARPARRPSYRSRLETLEDRCVPSSAPLDPSFGSNGVATTSLPGGNDTTVLGDLLQPNGDIIAYGATFVAGKSSQFLARYTPTGSLDATFGSGGLVETTPGGYDNTGKAALQTNGQIVFVSGSWLFRYNSDGSLDTTFGSGGVVTLPSGFTTVNGFNRTEPGLLILPSNGDIVIGGSSGSDSALLAYTPSGTLDSTFGNGGEVLTPGGPFHALAIENGDIVAGGGVPGAATGDLARYTLSGSLDTTFGSSGIAAFPGTLKSLLVQPNGQIIAFGNSSNLEWVLARYNVNGTLDTTFGSGGGVTSSPSGSDVARDAALESDGLIVVAGLAGLTTSEFGVYNASGSPDASFGSGGFVTTPWWSSPAYAGDGILVQPNGDIVIASDNGGSYTLLARYLPPAAQPGPSFAVSGFPSPTTAGVAQTVTVTAVNADDTVNTGYTGTVQFTSSDPQAVLPANYTFTAADQGVHTFTATLKTAGSQTITVADTTNGSIIGSESGIVVNPAAASQFILSAPSSVTHGKKFSVTLTVEDAYGNVVTGYVGTVHFTSSDSTATLPADYTFTAGDAGLHTFTSTFILRKRGTQTITVTDTQNGALTATDNINVT